MGEDLYCLRLVQLLNGINSKKCNSNEESALQKPLYVLYFYFDFARQTNVHGQEIELVLGLRLNRKKNGSEDSQCGNALFQNFPPLVLDKNFRTKLVEIFSGGGDALFFRSTYLCRLYLHSAATNSKNSRNKKIQA